MTASFWILLGILLVFSELLVPGFFIFFFGLGALITGAAAFIFPLSGCAQLFLFLATSLSTLALLRRFMPKVFQGNLKVGELPDEDLEFAGETAVVTEALQPGRAGKISFHGSTWNAVSKTPHQVGETVIVQSRKNLTITVE